MIIFNDRSQLTKRAADRETLFRSLIPPILHMETGELTHEIDPEVVGRANSYLMEMPHDGFIRTDAELHEHAMALARIGVPEKWARERLSQCCRNWPEKMAEQIPHLVEQGFLAAEMSDGAAKERLKDLNETYCAVFSTDYRIMYRAGGERWTAVSKQDFLSRYENEKTTNPNPGKGKPEFIALGRAWQEWRERKTADGTTFDTTAEPCAIVNGALNLWLGFGVVPQEGSCKRFKAMILNDLCSGSEDVFGYVLRWIAWKVQHPGELPEVSIALIGKKGTGKTTFGKTLVRIFGAHGMAANNAEQILGRFNGHLESKCFVYADESMWGGDRVHEGRLKILITDKDATFEYKGMTHFSGVNRVGLIFAGNEKWVVPATMDERRFCVSEVSDKHIAPDSAPPDHPNRLYWDAIHRELDNGGCEAFLYEMLSMDLGDWHPRIGVPRTKALASQKMQGLRGVEAWFHEMLRDGEMPDGVTVEGTPPASKWADGSLYVSPTAITKAYQDWLHHKNPHAVVTTRALLTDLRPFGWDGGDHCKIGKRRDRYWYAPKLDEARALFSKKMGADVFEAGG